MNDVQTGRYRCFPCQAVLPSVDAWRTHVIEQHGEKAFSAAGMQTPTPEQPIDMNNDIERTSVELGLVCIMRKQFGNGSLLPVILNAIRADLAVDADPYWMMSDAYNVRPQAKLTDAGRAYMRERGMIVQCTDGTNGGGCRRDVLTLAEQGPADGRCSGCAASLSQFGRVIEREPDDPELCGLCFVTYKRKVDPTYVLPRKQGGRYGR